MTIKNLLATKQEYLNSVEEAKRMAETAKAVRDEFRKQLKNTYTTSVLEGKNYIFFKDKWMYGSATTGVFSEDKFSGIDGVFYMKHHDLITGSQVKQIVSNLEIKVADDKISPDSYYLMAVIYEEPMYPTFEDSSEIDKKESIWEYLFIDLGAE